MSPDGEAETTGSIDRQSSPTPRALRRSCSTPSHASDLTGGGLTGPGAMPARYRSQLRSGSGTAAASVGQPEVPLPVPAVLGGPPLPADRGPVVIEPADVALAEVQRAEVRLGPFEGPGTAVEG